MKFENNLPAIVAGTAITAAIVMTIPSKAMALTGEEVNEIAREVSVLILDSKPDPQTGLQANGSGVIIAKDGNTYYVLTANHFVNFPSEYQIVTHDKKNHKLELEKTKVLPGVDLAVVQFTADEDYKVAKLANSDLAKQGGSVFVSGWPAPGGAIKELTRQFTGGIVTSRLEKPVANGYSLVYDNTTRIGMSGGPVFDAGGRVIAIHGLGETEDPKRLELQLNKIGIGQESARQITGLFKPGFNLAIPMNTFLTGAPQAGIYLSLQVENSPVASAVESRREYPADERDKFNLENILQRKLEQQLERGIERILPF